MSMNKNDAPTTKLDSNTAPLSSAIGKYWNNRADTYSNGVVSEFFTREWDSWEEILTHALAPLTCNSNPSFYVDRAHEHLNSSEQSLKILDLGCGPGFFEVMLSRMGHHVTAVDTSDSMLQKAGYNVQNYGVASNVSFMQGDVSQLPFEDASFDAIVLRNVTWLMRSPRDSYAEWKRVLKPSGRLLVFDANWYRYLADEDQDRKRREDQRDIATLGWEVDERATSKQECECEDIAKNLPLTYEDRPSWDVAVLKQLGFSAVSVNEDVYRQVWTSGEQNYYGSSPLFMITATK